MKGSTTPEGAPPVIEEGEEEEEEEEEVSTRASKTKTRQARLVSKSTSLALFCRRVNPYRSLFSFASLSPFCSRKKRKNPMSPALPPPLISPPRATFLPSHLRPPPPLATPFTTKKLRQQQQQLNVTPMFPPQRLVVSRVSHLQRCPLVLMKIRGRSSSC